MSDYLTQPDRHAATLEAWTQLYQDVRLPRAQKAQETAREAGMVYEMQTPEMSQKSYDECLPLVRESLKDRMQWVWTENIDTAYEAKRQSLIP
jgi:salicylate hydroxylase